MEVIPAIDIKDGRCIRLYQGDFTKESVFSPNPVEIACRWAELGAPRLHIVDLDGAREGKPKNLSLVEKITHKVNIPIQLGGGLRELETIKQALDIGVDRVILGTISISQPDLISQAAQLFRDRIAVSLDTQQGYLAIKGWQYQTKVKPEEAVSRLTRYGIRFFIYTDILRDGTLTQPNFEAVSQLLPLVPHLIVGGGISNLKQIERLFQMGVEGVILGMALYTGMIDLRGGLKICSPKG